MIDFYLLNKNNTVKNTLLVFFNDNSKPSLQDAKFDLLNLYNPKPNPWFFYHIKNYLKEIRSFKEKYSNLLLFGGSKGGSAAIIISFLLNKERIFQNILCWAMSPVIDIKYNHSISSQGCFVSYWWEKIKNDESIKPIIEKYGEVYNYIDCSFPLLYSYSYSKEWMFDKNQFDLLKNKDCVTEDYLACTSEIMKFTSRPVHENIHNVLGYYWKVERELFYTKLERFITENIK